MRAKGLLVLCALVSLSRGAHAAPPNDECTAATPITATPFTDTLDVSGATAGPGDTFACIPSTDYGSVWYAFAPTTSAFVTATSTGSDFPVVLQAFNGTCSGKTFLTCGEPLSFNACAGKTYLLAAKRLSSTPTNLVFNVTTAPELDGDGDGVGDCADNCRNQANPGQENGDGDGDGDVCDSCPLVAPANDSDGDCAPNGADNCPGLYNPEQGDIDGDGIGNRCDDSDGDGVSDLGDNCPFIPNASQADDDTDHIGNACDDCQDYDHDGLGDGNCPFDNCPYRSNPDQTDTDGDGVGDVCYVCAALGGATRWNVLASDAAVIRERGGEHHRTEVTRSMCAGKANLRTFSVSRDLVALANQGTAVAVRRPSWDGDQGSYLNSLGGSLITGGGKVVGVQYFSQTEVPDTSGTSPRLVECQAAIADALTASAALAARPPTHVFGKVVIKKAEVFTIDATGGAVINMESLTMSSAREIPYEGPIKDCIYSMDEASTLEIISDPGDQVVINVGRLRLGDCAHLYMRPALFNVPGPGTPVKIGNQVGQFSEYANPIILAPQRKVDILGSRLDFPPVLNGVWAQSLKASGYVFLGAPLGLGCGS